MDPLACWKLIIEIITTLANGGPDVDSSWERESLESSLRDLARWVEMGGGVEWQKLLDYAKTQGSD
jgi:hypothetical protein